MEIDDQRADRSRTAIVARIAAEEHLESASWGTDGVYAGVWGIWRGCTRALHVITFVPVRRLR